MEVNLAQIFNVLLMAGVAAVGWYVKRQADELRQLERDFNGLSIRLAGEFVSKSDLDRRLDDMDRKLDKIFDKLDTKADKP